MQNEDDLEKPVLRIATLLLAPLQSLFVFFNHALNAYTHTTSSPAEMCFQNLSHIHTRGNPRGLSTISTAVPSSRYGMFSIGMIWRYNPFVTVSTGHFVTNLQLALNRDVYLYHLDNTQIELITLVQT